jgi:glycosyltransferase involved in cell wall biosynthesis
MRVLVATIVHHPDDPRILHRQIRALLDAGHDVTYAAPFVDGDAVPWRAVTGVDLPRARGRSRLKAAAAAGRVLRPHADAADVVLIHDIELLLAVRALSHPCVVWDVHDDDAAKSRKPWWPAPAGPLAALAARVAERWAEQHVRLILAEPRYRARFRRPHPVVRNVTAVPEFVAPPVQPRAVYIGPMTFSCGLAELIEVGERLGGAVEVELIGPAVGAARAALVEAAAAGHVRWFGRLSYDEALLRLDGAVAGLSLLHDTAHHRRFEPANVCAYMAHGVPVVTTPLDEPAALVESERCGIVVPFHDAAATARAVLRLYDDEYLAGALGARGHASALASHDWRKEARAFVRQLASWAATAGSTRRVDTGARAVVSSAHAD